MVYCDKNLVELLENTAQENPKKSFTFTSYSTNASTSINYSELLQKATKIAALIQSKTEIGDRVVLLFPPGINFIIAFYGCILSGAIAIPLPPPFNVESALRFENVIKNSKPKIVLSEKMIDSKIHAIGKISRFKALPLFEKIYAYLRNWSQLWINVDALTEDEMNLGWQRIKVDAAKPCYLQYTSGSTRRPQGVIVSHSNVLANLEGIQQTLGLNASDVAVSWLPFYHDMGLIGFLFGSIRYQCDCWLMSPFDFFRNPYHWLDNISKHRAVITAAPNFAFDLCVKKISEEQKASLNLDSLRVVLTGGEPIRHGTIKNFSEHFHSCGFKSRAFLPAYGLAEATVAVSMKNAYESPVCLKVDEHDLRLHLISELIDKESEGKIIYGCGKVLPEAEVVVVDPESHRVVKNKVGEFWIRGPYVSQGYWNNPASNESAFAGYLADGSGPYLRTGDLGFMHNKELYITGRTKDLIIIHGRNYYPHDIEYTVEQCYPGIRESYVVAFSINVAMEERLVIVAEMSPTKNFDVDHCLKAIKNAVTKDHGLAAYGIVLIRAKTLPKTTSGKSQRQKTKQLFLNKELSIISDWQTKEFSSIGQG